LSDEAPIKVMNKKNHQQARAAITQRVINPAISKNPSTVVLLPSTERFTRRHVLHRVSSESGEQMLLPETLGTPHRQRLL
jgi:hypothetical protein